MLLEFQKLDTKLELLKKGPLPKDAQRLLSDLEGNTSVLALLQLSTDALDVDVCERLAMIGSALLKNSAPTGLNFMKECWEVSSAEADRIADQLVEAGVLEPHATVGGVRYFRTHDIIRNHAVQLRQQMLNDGR